MSSELKEDLEKQYKFTDLRELAKEHDTSEDRISEELQELGFTTLQDFGATEEVSDSMDLTYQVSEMERRKLQGLFGERVAVFIKGKIKRFLKQSLPDDWGIHQGVKLRTSGAQPKKSLWFGEKRTDGAGIDISDSTIRHRNMDKEKIREKVRKRHFYCSEDLFEQFQRHRIPSIDEVFYAVKKTGNQKGKDYHLVNSEASSFTNQETEKIDLDEVKDFKVIGVEIKTTENRAESLLSSLQRELRDKAKESPYLDIYSLKVQWEKNRTELPKEVDLRIEKIS